MTEEEAREAVEVAYQLAELEKRPEWEYFRNFVKSFAAAQQNRLLNMQIDSLKDVGVLVRMSGWLNGAQFALNAPATAAKIAQGVPVEKAGG